MKLYKLTNRSLDALARPEFVVLNRSRSAFKLCGYTGLISAVSLAFVLVMQLGLPLWVLALLVLSSALTFLALAMATKIITAKERLIYYHHEIAVIAVASFVLWILRQPMLPYLDVTILGVGVFLMFGRIGCLMVGCCHGRPHRWGVRYRDEHAAAGFTGYLVGVRLFPIQAVESLWALCIVAAGSLMIVSGQPVGAAIAWYIVTYDVGRFCFEFMRGDPERSYWRGFSEAQWISAGLTMLVAIAELSGLLPLQWWHVEAAACLVIAMVIIVAVRNSRRTPRHELLHPRHTKELAEAVEKVSRLDEEAQSGQEEVHIYRTSLGVLISASSVAGNVCHYALSYQNKVMDEDTARILAELICLVRRCPSSFELIKGSHAVFHMLTSPCSLSARPATEIAESGNTSLLEMPT
jgi:hypothetical protein